MARPNISNRFQREALPGTRSAELDSISICPNRRGPRLYFGARLWSKTQPQQRFDSTGVLRLVLRTQPRSVLVAAWPRCAVSPICNRQTVEMLQRFRIGGRPQNAILRNGRVQLCATNETALRRALRRTSHLLLRLIFICVPWQHWRPRSSAASRGPSRHHPCSGLGQIRRRPCQYVHRTTWDHPRLRGRGPSKGGRKRAAA